MRLLIIVGKKNTHVEYENECGVILSIHNLFVT